MRDHARCIASFSKLALKVFILGEIDEGTLLHCLFVRTSVERTDRSGLISTLNGCIACSSELALKK